MPAGGGALPTVERAVQGGSADVHQAVVIWKVECEGGDIPADGMTQAVACDAWIVIAPVPRQNITSVRAACV